MSEKNATLKGLGMVWAKICEMVPRYRRIGRWGWGWLLCWGACQAIAGPTVSITSPAPNTVFAAPASITINVAASSPWGMKKVEFFQNGVQIAYDQAAPYTFTWSEVRSGTYVLTAKATDNLYSSNTSAPVTITVTPSVYYIHSDHLNTPRLVTDGQARTVWRRSPLDEPFGNSLPEEDPDGNGTPFTLNLRFPGQYFDKETNLTYNYFRDYNSAVGRYLQSDPVGLMGGINTYAYVNNAPMMFTDPLGLQAVPMPPPPVPGFPTSGGSQGKGDDGSMGGVFPPGTFPGNTSNNGGPMSTPDPVEAAAGNQVDTAIQNAYNNYASNARMNCPNKDPDDRCKWLSENAHLFSAAAVKATEKAWGCRKSRWSRGNKY